MTGESMMGEAAIQVRVKLFAVLAEAAGVRELVLALPAGSTPKEVWRVLQARSQALRAWVERQGAEQVARSLSVAINLAYGSWDAALRDQDEVAFIPPVAGGAGDGKEGDGEGDAAAMPVAPSFVEVTDAPLSLDGMLARVRTPEAGAIAVFAGIVREWTGALRTVSLAYEAYRPMAERTMQQVADEVLARWPGARVALAHRTGTLGPGEVSVVVAVATPHRAAAFEACRYAIDRIKQIVPIWKKEHFPDGSVWVGWQGEAPGAESA